jgi:coproporphyrinogen III oxidase
MDGEVFEKAGCNLSVVYGTMPQEALKAATERGVDRAKGLKPGERIPFFACGLSSVMHPKNPFAPTMHFNYRYFETDGGVWWFGGGIDLTPYYPYAEDAAHFHQTIKAACDKSHKEYYPIFKRWCDEYFYLKHRQEMRGVGGIFFDYQDGQGELYKGPDNQGPAATYSKQLGIPESRNWESLFTFVQNCGMSFLPAYKVIVERRQSMKYSDRERNFQLYRRGRYVEFNLVYDRGTIFGLQTNGRTESILMSLPPLVRWEYGYNPEPNTPEAELYEVFLKPHDWADWKPNH